MVDTKNKKNTKTKKASRRSRPVTNGMKANVYNTEGKKTSTIELPESVFGTGWNADLVHQVVVSMQANARQPIAHAKDRSEQRGGGRKPWRQKGTGRARHGSRRSPIWRGGGVTFGPRNEKDYGKKINKKVRRKALATTLTKKYADGDILFIDEVKFKEPKAKEAKLLLEALGGIQGFDDLAAKKNNAVLIALFENDMATKKSFSNFGNVLVTEVRNLNPLDLLTYKYLVISKPKESVAALEARLS